MLKSFYACTQTPFRAGMKTRYLSCPVDGGPIQIRYDYKKIQKKVRGKAFLHAPITHWKYRDFFPTLPETSIVSLGEGGTPLIPDISDNQLFFKCEGSNPSGSFKDRGSTLEISWAKHTVVKHVVCASTGNMGASIAAYATRAKIPATILVPRIAEERKVRQMKAHHAFVKRIPGDYTKALQVSLDFSRTHGHYPVGDYPFRREGEKSAGFEIADQLQWKAPKNVVCPVGNGTLISGVYKAFDELKKTGLIARVPRMIGVQAHACCPVVRAFENKKPLQPLDNPDTIASAIACGNPLDGILAVDALEQSNGWGVSVSDQETLHARQELARQGIYAEPSGAVAYAGYCARPPSGSTVVIVSGHGLKTST